MRTAVVLIAWLVTANAFAAAPPFIAVKGEGRAEVAPDFVKVTATVAAEDKQVERAKQEADGRMQRVLTGLAPFRIAKPDMSFGGVVVEPTYHNDRNDNQSITGYRVTRTLTLKIRHLSDYEQVGSALTAAGVERIDSPESDVDDPVRLKTAALKQATMNARTQALAIASELGMQLGAPLEVGEDRFWPRSQSDQDFASDHDVQEIMVTASRRGAPAPPPPLLFVPGPIKVEATVWVRFEMLPSK